MYDYEQRIKAVEMYLELNSAEKVVKHLGYPSLKILRKWIYEYKETGDLHKESRKINPRKYTIEEKEAAVNFYLNSKYGYHKAAKILGYPASSMQLRSWVMESKKYKNKTCDLSLDMIEYSKDNFIKAVVELCDCKDSLETICEKYNISKNILKDAAAVLLSKEHLNTMNNELNNGTLDYEEIKESVDQLKKEKNELEEERLRLQEEVHRLKIERDALEVAGIMLKKYAGINLKMMSNREKTIVIDALNNKYRLNDLFQVLNISRSSYYYQHQAVSKPDRDEKYNEQIKTIFSDNHKEYGYRRIHAVLHEMGIIISEKRVRRIMKKEELKVYNKRTKKYSSYLGEISPAVANKINRDFHAEKPNEKWLTDISEFSIPAGKIYLSPIIDCFDGMPVSWSIGTTPDSDLANSMLDKAVLTLKDNEHPIVHSDRGSHYRWPGWIQRMEKYQLIRSMSKKGCSPDNSACEGFFGLIKKAVFYGRDWSGYTVKEFINFLNDYLIWFREKRIKQKLGYKSPLDYRASIGIPFVSNISI